MPERELAEECRPFLTTLDERGKLDRSGAFLAVASQCLPLKGW